jgi:hypothetical protein
MPEFATYLYCVVRSTRSPSAGRGLQGVRGADKPRIVALGGSLWLVVSQVPLDVYASDRLAVALRDLQWVSDVAVSHESVVEYFARPRGTAVVPMKLFTMFSSLDRAIEEMRARRPEILEVLKRVAGCEEWGVRVTRTPVHVSAGTIGVRRIASGAAFLAAKKAIRDQTQEAARRAAEAADETYAALAALSRSARRRDDTSSGAARPPLLDAAFLVPSRSRARFRGAARRLAAGCADVGAEMTLTGPWPAYNFIQTPEQPQ